MKRTLILALGVLLTITIQAQKEKPPVPETLNEIHYYNKPASKLEALQKDKAKYVNKMKALGYGGVSVNFVLDGDKASIHFAQTDRMSFIVALADGMGDPTGWFNFYKATIKKGKRSGTLSEVKFMSTSATSREAISYSVKKIGDQVYEIIPETKLEKGEYFFVNKGTLSKYGNSAVDAFAFCID